MSCSNLYPSQVHRLTVAAEINDSVPAHEFLRLIPPSVDYDHRIFGVLFFICVWEKTSRDEELPYMSIVF